MKHPKRVMLILTVLCLLFIPFLIVKYGYYYPKGYDYKQHALHLSIYELNEKGERSTTYIKENPTPPIIRKANGEEVYVPVRMYIAHLKKWYQDMSLSVGLVLAAFALVVIPKGVINELFWLPHWLKQELKQDFPKFYRLFLKKGFTMVYALLLLGVSLVILTQVWDAYPLEKVNKVAHLIDTL